METINNLLSIETVSLVGVLIVAVGLLVSHIKYLNSELKSKDKVIYGFLEKFTELTTEIKGYLKGN
jgi:hypothetical protein